MTVPVYSYCFYRNRGLVGRQTILVPDGYTMVIREWDVYANITPGSSATWFIEDHGTGAAIWVINIQDGPLDGRIINQVTGHVVIGKGGGFVIDSAAQADHTVSGYLLAGNAPVEIVGSPLP